MNRTSRYLMTATIALALSAPVFAQTSPYTAPANPISVTGVVTASSQYASNALWLVFSKASLRTVIERVDVNCVSGSNDALTGASLMVVGRDTDNKAAWVIVPIQMIKQYSSAQGSFWMGSLKGPFYPNSVYSWPEAAVRFSHATTTETTTCTFSVTGFYGLGQ